MDKQSKIILISGPTASGKSNFAVKIAKKINGEIINADSMQVYKRLKILTARPSNKNKQNIKHHLYGVIDLDKKFSTGEWLKATIKKIKEIKKIKKVPILVGGTGLYFQSLINGLVEIPEIPVKFRNRIRAIHKKEGQKKFYKKLLKIDPKIKGKFDQNDSQRTIRAFEIKSFTKVSMYDWFNKTTSEFRDSDFLKLYLSVDREELIKRINKRTLVMMKEGAIKEVKKFISLKIKKEQSVNKVIGIDELTQYLENKIDLDEAVELILIKTRQYAKRQATWARTRMTSWNKITLTAIDGYIKKLNKSSLKLDQLT
ncbi:MAG: tRNA dimethylallyltransferase [Pelagibacteraceae bacterium BACL20 MAG-120920-bin64]|jgi:tRNA dimethylallyltransferase|uniref:tRNA (adenosine(37)-N6)-dimethylallyltransferase MiaA n=1 Tax=Candidatus Pelagibacter sp. TaxID=2024849 RepID=UPI0007156B61|nr:MAG: tRNA dimethylallyltransferase [Pelagibacteraceae bacterium BACL20 MAG-120920-bin64]|tara:strand:+ start:26 stop:967 length:942 start_codon:yes stop_codon:yes gene_type:complete